MQLMLKVLSVKSRSIYVCNAAPVFFFCDLFNVLKNSMSYLKMLPGKAWVAWLNLGRLHEFILYNIVYHSNVWLFAHSVLSSLRLWCLEIPGNGKFKQGYQISPQVSYPFFILLFSVVLVHSCSDESKLSKSACSARRSKWYKVALP